MEKCVLHLARRSSESEKAMDNLAEALQEFYEYAPQLFPRPLDQMGASDKMSIARDLLKIIKLAEC